MKTRHQVRRFGQIMERKLRDNDDKGGWDDCDPEWLLKRLRQETRELARAMGKWAVVSPSAVPGDECQRIGREAADVANFAMMIADRFDALPAFRAPRRKAKPK